MFVKELPKRNNDSQLLAWTFCKMQRYLVCLKLKKEKSSWTRNENLYFVEADLLIDFHPMQLYLKLSEPEFQPEEGGNGLHVSYSLVVLGSDIFDDRDHSSKRCRMGLQHYCVTEAIGGQLEILEVSEYTTGNRGNCTRPWFHPCDIFEDLDHGHEWDCLRVKAINNEEDSPEEVVVVIGQQHRYTWRSNIWCGIQEETNGLALESIREAWYVKHQSTTFPQFFHDRARHTFKNGDVISVAVKRRYKDTDKAKSDMAEFIDRPQEGSHPYRRTGRMRKRTRRTNNPSSAFQVQRCQRHNLRIFVRSRPELRIRLGFMKIGSDTYKNIALHDIPEHIVDHGLRVVLAFELEQIREERSIQPPWPTQDELVALISVTRPLFIHAATVCRFVSDRRLGNPRDLLEEILKSGASSSISKLKAAYSPVLHQLIANLDKEQRDIVI
ncbi:hypothetical protein K432DRAFT_463270 [Lepidopterella palustris CBS 459.81]|uniref:Uncharacterized protein n=1 Tax=Lepidopterella palustris CBS 459.81 TaxID=1314670 RepID=A0A8E2EHV5_9PEZI|nr:hypothetical protein K432DRAFT_463270 [Lepidopterella palustris CBS 459.81]